MKFSERLKEQRVAHSFSQASLAKYLSVSQVSISNWERGSKEPDFKVLVDLASLFSTTTDYLLGVTDRKS